MKISARYLLDPESHEITFRTGLGYAGAAENHSDAALSAVRPALGAIHDLFPVLAAFVVQKSGVTSQLFRAIRENLERGPDQGDPP
ncbi:MAG: hypothetical protein GY717_11030 [Rhodobacteraceae bacterium]|nr:hypothetical protein [Paracoccaceae bacterium]